MCKQTEIGGVRNTKLEREIQKAASRREITVAWDTSTWRHENRQPYKWRSKCESSPKQLSYKQNNMLPKRLWQDFKAMAGLTDIKVQRKPKRANKTQTGWTRYGKELMHIPTTSPQQRKTREIIQFPNIQSSVFIKLHLYAFFIIYTNLSSCVLIYPHLPLTIFINPYIPSSTFNHVRFPLFSFICLQWL